MSTPPREATTTELRADAVLESLERALTKLNRRTRAVMSLADEREELIAAIENRSVTAPSLVEPAGIESAVHGASATTEATDSPAASEANDDLPPATDAPAEVSDAAPRPPAAPPAREPARPVDEHEPLATETIREHPDPEAGVGPTTSWEDAPPDPISDETPVADRTSWDAQLADDEGAASAPWDEPIAEHDVAQHQVADVQADGGTEVSSLEPAIQSDEPPATSAVQASESATPAWDRPDLEWSEPATETPPEIAPHDFPHPMPPVDADYVTAPDDLPALEVDDGSGQDDTEANLVPRDSGLRTDSGDDAASSNESPFATEFEEHVEELGGSLEASPFDLDTPPSPTSYRPRSMQSAREGDTAPAALRDDTAGSDHDGQHVADAWDDFAGSPEQAGSEVDSSRSAVTSDDAAPAPSSDEGGPSSGSRLRDLVAQAQRAERDRAAEAQSDFELINEDASVSRYDKNSANLPTVGISSEELSSSVASLRTSFTSDKKSAPSGRDDKQSRADKKAEKKAAKEAKAAAKRARKES